MSQLNFDNINLFPIVLIVQMYFVNVLSMGCFLFVTTIIFRNFQTIKKNLNRAKGNAQLYSEEQKTL